MVEVDASAPIRIGFVLTELVGGGAERTMLSIIDALDRRRFAPTLIVFDARQDHAPPSGVPIVVLARRGATGIGRLISRARELSRIVERERLDLLVSFLIGPNIVAVAAARMAGVPVIVGERSAPRTVLSKENERLRARGVWSMLVRLMYPRASRIVTNTAGAKTELLDFLRIRPDQVAVIPNPIDLRRIETLAAEPIGDRAWPEGPVLVHVGRFTVAKDHDTLLNAFTRIRRARAATLVLVGDGEDEARIRALTTTLGVERDVIFTGFTRNPYQFLARATISVLTSRFEGLPNVLIESMALGVPIVSTACPYGPLEVLGDNEYGVLTPVGDAAAFADAVEKLLDDEPRRRALAERGRRRALDFDRERVGPLYEQLFAAVARPAAAAEPLKSSRATST